MKKIAYFLLAVPLITFQCSTTGDEYDCGCNSKIVLKELVDVKARIEKINTDLPDRIFYIFPEDEDISDGADYFHILISCDSSTFNDKDFVDGSQIEITGDIKSLCPTRARIGSSGIKVKEVRLIK